MLSIIGCGDSNRQDDGAGVYVAQTLISQLHECSYDNVQVFDAGTSAMDIMFQARGSDALNIIDAIFLLMPVQQAGGGLLFKIKNAKGDRIVHAIEFFQQHGIEVEEEKVLEVEWSTELAALTFPVT